MTHPHQDVKVGPAALAGELTVPSEARGLVVLADGSTERRDALRHRSVAGMLNRRRIATLLLDLLTPAEAAAGSDETTLVHRLATRLLQAVDWARKQPALAALPVGLFAAGDAAAAAVLAATERPGEVAAIVSRAGRLDLAAGALGRLRAPTLLVVGDLDAERLADNREAQRAIAGERRLHLVARATRLFEEAGALEQVANVAGDWFETHLVRQRPPVNGR